jgi:hypothetical protein
MAPRAEVPRRSRRTRQASTRLDPAAWILK